MIEIFYILIFCTCFLLNFYKLFKKYKFFEILIHPIIFVTAYFVIFFFFPAYSKTLYIPAIFRERYFFSKKEIFFVIQLVVITYTIITFYFFFRTGKENNKKSAKRYKIRKYPIILKSYIILYSFFVFLIFVVLIEKFGGITTVLNNYPIFIMKARQGSSSLLYIIYSIELIPAVYLMFSEKIDRLFFVLILIYSMLLVSFTGARILIITILIQNYFIMLIRKFINLKLFLVLLFFFFFLFISVSWMRSAYNITDMHSFNQALIDLKNYWIRNIDQFINSLVVIKEIKEGNINFQKGRTLIDSVYFFIPSKLYPKKPLSYYPSRLIYGEVASSSGQTFNFGMIGRSYLEFGTFGVIISNILLFIIFLKIYEKLIQLRYKIGTFSFTDLILLYIYSHILQVYLLGIFSHIGSYFLLFIILLAFFFFGYKLFRSFIKGAILGSLTKY